jgi:hypothetical protein
MEKTQFKINMSKVQKFFKNLANYFIISVSLIIGFTIGFNYEKIIDFKSTERIKPKVFKKFQVSTAFDEHDNIMIINKDDGKYFILDDSIGQTILGAHAKKIWKEHSPEPLKDNENK